MRLSNLSVLITVIFVCFGPFVLTVYAQNPFNWDSIDSQSKPWARWWWFGNSVNEAEISRQLQELKRVGFGGVEIQPIYPEENSPIEPIVYLSKRWGEVFLFTLQEAHRLGLGVDLTLGSGWPFGGPWLKPQNAARKLNILQKEYNANTSSRSIIDDNDIPIECVLIVPINNPSAEAQLLNYTVNDSKKQWTIPSGDWKAYFVKIGYTGQQVKRATVGSEGPVLDHFSKIAFENYAEPFDAVLNQIRQMRPRSNFNDSYEVYGANATPELFTAFQNLHGYDLRKYIPVLIDSTNVTIRPKILHDYRETIYSLYVNQFCSPWANWSHKNQMKIRFQAHGAPGNLIDLYGLADIPETEGFGRGGIDLLVGKFATSGAHLYGRDLCSAEVFTWIDEHFYVSLDMMKRSADNFFLTGINHFFYQGVPFSQPNDPFPGAVFYASTHVGESNTWWNHLHYLNDYITKIQSAFQSHDFDPDVVIYFPVHDMWNYTIGAQDLLQFCEVQNWKDWFQGAAPLTWQTSNLLHEEGWQFDYISDKVINELLTVQNSEISVNKYRYKAMIIAGAKFIEENTLHKIQQLVAQGTKVIFVNNIPKSLERKPPENTTSPLNKNLYEEYFNKFLNKSVFKVNTVDELPELLNTLKIKNENIATNGIKFIRFKNSSDKIYFLKNATNEKIDKLIDLNCSGNTVLVADPLNGTIAKAEIQKSDLTTKVHIVMDPQASLLLSVNQKSNSNFPEFQMAGKPINEIKLTGPWKLAWKDYDNNLHTKEISKLESWTEWQETKYFSGEMEYQTSFNITEVSITKKYVLDVGRLHESAEVFLNGSFAGALWTIPYKLDISGKVKSGENNITIKVINLMANRIINLDRTGVKWRRYFFVNIDYKPFDASGWKLLPSGLLGPARIIVSR